MTELKRLVVVDLEGTCWEPGENAALAANQVNEAEIIEVGAVCLSGQAEAFRAVVRPRRHPTLSAFCTQLTGLTQQDMDAGVPFPQALAEFVEWAGGDEGLTLASWGSWDDRQLRQDAARHDLPRPRWQHVNIKRAFARRARARGAPRRGWLSLTRSLEWLGWTFEGTQHRAVDDARNAARILDWVRQAGSPPATRGAALPARGGGAGKPVQ